MGRCLETGRALRGPDHPTRGCVDHTMVGRTPVPIYASGPTPPGSRSAGRFNALMALCWGALAPPTKAQRLGCQPRPVLNSHLE